MRQFTVTIPDNFYEKLMSFLAPVPEAVVEEKITNEVPLWQQEMVLERMKNAKPEDYLDADTALEDLKKKYGF
jgi:hypothetical protein